VIGLPDDPSSDSESMESPSLRAVFSALGSAISELKSLARFKARRIGTWTLWAVVGAIIPLSFDAIIRSNDKEFGWWSFLRQGGLLVVTFVIVTGTLGEALSRGHKPKGAADQLARFGCFSSCALVACTYGAVPYANSDLIVYGSMTVFSVNALCCMIVVDGMVRSG